MAYKKQKGGPKMYRKDGALPMKSPMKNINNMKEYSKPGDAVQYGDGIKMYGSPNEMETPTYMKSPIESSPAKGLVRGLGPHNPAHEAVGDNSDAAHSLPDFADKPKPKEKSIFDIEESEETAPTQMKSPMKAKPTTKDLPPFYEGEDDGSATKMKSSGFKMKSGSPFQRNFGVSASPVKAAKPDYPDIDGDGNTTESMKQAAADKKSPIEMASPMKNQGIYPVDVDGMISGPAMSSTAAADHVKNGGKVLKTGLDKVASETADPLPDGVTEKTLSEYKDGVLNPNYVKGKVTKDSQGNTEKQKVQPEIINTGQKPGGANSTRTNYIVGDNAVGKNSYFEEREILNATNTDADEVGGSSQLASYKKKLSPELYEAEIKIQDFRNKFGDEADLPAELVDASSKIQSFIKEQQGLQDGGRQGMTIGDTEYSWEEQEEDNVVDGGVGRVEGKGPGKDRVGMQINDRTNMFQDLEMTDGVAQASGTSAEEEKTRLANIEIAKKEQIKIEADKKKSDLIEKERLETEKAEAVNTWQNNKPSPYDFSGENAAMEWKEAMNKWEANKPKTTSTSKPQTFAIN